ncbi:MAG: DNA ligase [Synergistaceae bacterium]|nr:DNA ligase [Synergistaceae bacterium]
MSKMGELDLCVSELRSVAQSLNTVADSLTSLFSGSQPRTSVQPESKPTSKPLTLEDVRAVLAEKSRNGHTAKIRELLEKHGAAKLSEIDPQKYSVLLAEAEVLGNG